MTTATTPTRTGGLVNRLLTARDPYLDDAEAARLQQLRTLRKDDAVTLADLAFATGLYDRLANNLDTIRREAAAAALNFRDLAEQQRRDRSLLDRLSPLPRPAYWVGLAGLVLLVIGLAIVAL